MRLFAHFFTQGLEAVVNRLRLHHHAHAAAIGRVIHTIMLIERVVPDVTAIELHKPAFSRASDDALPQHRVAHFGKEGQNIDTHRFPIDPFSGVKNLFFTLLSPPARQRFP